VLHSLGKELEVVIHSLGIRGCVTFDLALGIIGNYAPELEAVLHFNATLYLALGIIRIRAVWH